MRKIYVTSDHHFGHANILKFTDYEGKLIRPGFDDVNHMNETMIERWNSVVKDDDIVYHLGDLCFDNKMLHKVMPRLKGHKRIILGNHDKLHMREYLVYFQKVGSAKYLGGPDFPQPFFLTHYPTHVMSFRYKGNNQCVNLHGHTHEKDVLQDNGDWDNRYFNVCVEKTKYTPMTLEEVYEIVKAREGIPPF